MGRCNQVATEKAFPVSVLIFSESGFRKRSANGAMEKTDAIPLRLDRIRRPIFSNSSKGCLRTKSRTNEPNTQNHLSGGVDGLPVPPEGHLFGERNNLTEPFHLVNYAPQRRQCVGIGPNEVLVAKLGICCRTYCGRE